MGLKYARKRISQQISRTQRQFIYGKQMQMVIKPPPPPPMLKSQVELVLCRAGDYITLVARYTVGLTSKDLYKVEQVLVIFSC